MAKIDSTPTKINTPESGDLSAILARLERLEKENAELKETKENPFTKAKKIYEWPRHYSYKMWAGVPVLGYTSKRKDPSKDLAFKNQFWELQSNHYLVLQLANWETEEVEVNEFNASFARSDKLPAKVVTNEDGSICYWFKEAEHWEFLVNNNIIN